MNDYNVEKYMYTTATVLAWIFINFFVNTKEIFDLMLSELCLHIGISNFSLYIIFLAYGSFIIIGIFKRIFDNDKSDEKVG
jgi:hypothetical protein